MSRSLTIKQVADQTGFTPPTLRYYDQIGLVTPRRSPSGYRQYDDAGVARLVFVERAKRLGCSLDEVRDLLRAWDGGECGPVQDRLRSLVTEKICAAQGQVAQLVGLVADLRRAAALLGRHRPQGPCDDRCGCLGGSAFAQTASVPVVCSLAPSELGDRLGEWREVLSHVSLRDEIEGGLHLDFAVGVSVEQLVTLAAAEHKCCPFISFAVTIDERGVGLDARSPDAGRAVLDALLGRGIGRVTLSEEVSVCCGGIETPAVGEELTTCCGGGR